MRQPAGYVVRAGAAGRPVRAGHNGDAMQGRCDRSRSVASRPSVAKSSATHRAAVQSRYHPFDPLIFKRIQPSNQERKG